MTSLSFERIIARDFVIAGEVQRSVVNDYVLALEIGRTARRDAVVPLEIGAGTAVTMNAVAPVEWAATFTGASGVIPVEYASSRFRDAVAAFDWQAGLSVDAAIAAASGVSVAVLFLFPSEGRQTAVRAVTAPVDWAAPVSRTVPGPSEAGLAVRADVGSVSAENLSTVSLSAGIPVQFLPTIQSDTVITLETGASTSVAVSGDARIPLAWFSETVFDRVVPVGVGSVIVTTIIDHTEWTGGAASYGDTVMAIETGSGVRFTAAVPMDTVTLVSVDRVIPLASTAITAVQMDVVIGRMASLVSNETVVLSTVTTCAIDQRVAVSWRADVVMADADVSIEWSRLIDQDFDAALWWESEISADVQALIETAVTLTNRDADAEIPVEWTMPVMADVVVPFERWFDRDAIGTSLEPDEWEKEHG